MDDLRWWLDPSAGAVPVGLPCPACGGAEQDAQHTRLAYGAGERAVFEA
ncbi:hypothetical protein ABZ543_25125 [Streptomyces roseifaciens]